MDNWSMAGVLWNTAYYMMGKLYSKTEYKIFGRKSDFGLVKIGSHRLLFSGLNFAF